MRKTMICLAVSLLNACSLSLAADSIPPQGLKGNMPASQTHKQLLHAEEGDLLQLDLDAPSFMMDLIVTDPTGDLVEKYTTGIYGTNSYSRRFLARQSGDYSVQIKNWDNAKDYPYIFKKTEHLNRADYQQKFKNLPSLLEAASIPINKEFWPALAEKLKGNRIVSFGEPSHGGKEFWQYRLNLTIAMAEKNNLRTIAMELPYGDLLRLNDYILGKSDGKKRAMSDLQFSLWHVDAINDFFEGLRQYNLRQAEDSRIKIVGIDLHPNENDETSVQNLFKGNDNSESANIADIFDSKWLKIIQKILARKGSTEDVKQLDAPIEKARALLKKTPNNQNAWLALHGRLQYLDLYRKPFPQNFSLRDQVLAERIHWLEQNTPQNQTLLFLAHNVHISKASTGYLAERTGWYLNKSYPNRYAAIAGTFGKGDFTAIVSGGGARLKNFTTSDAPAETLEYYLSQFKTQAGYLLQLKQLANPSWLSQPIKMRSIPADSNIEVMKQQFELVNPVKEFDYILYLNEQTASD